MTKKLKNASVSGSITPVYTDDTKALIKKAGEAAAKDFVASAEGQQLINDTVEKVKLGAEFHPSEEANQSTYTGNPRRKLVWAEIDDSSFPNKVEATNGPKDDAPFLIDTDTRVIFRGEPLKPVATDVHLRYGEIIFEGKSIRVHHSGHAHNNDIPMNAYRFQLLGRDTLAFLDKDSFLEISAKGDNTPFDTDTRRFNSGEHAIILVNSTSLDDNFIGVSYLEHIESVNNLFNNSSVRAATNHQGRREPVWDPDEYDSLRKIERFKVGDKRHRYRDCQFKKTTVTDSILLPGGYRNSVISNVTLASARRVTVDHASLSNCRVEASEIELWRTSISKCRLHADTKVIVRSIQLNKENFYFSALYLPNKFSYMEVPVVNRAPLKLVRVSPQEVEVGFNSNRMLKIKISEVDDWSLTDKVTELLKKNGQLGKEHAEATNEFTDSLVRYVMDSLRSRIRVIGLIDAAVNTTNILDSEMYPNDYDNIYEL